MEITEVRVKLLPGQEEGDKLRGFCSITIDGAFVVRDIKIIHGGRGTFVAMPSRRIEVHCRHCGHKNHLRARYCNDCGRRMGERNAEFDQRQRLFVDVAHPVNSQARKWVHDAIMREYERERERAMRPDYVFARPDDFEDGRDLDRADQLEAGS